MSSLLLFALLARRGTSHIASTGGCGGFGCFFVMFVIGLVIFLIMRGRRDRPELLGAAKRPMSTGAVQAVTFACPLSKCTNCGADTAKMKQQWDGLRKVTWTCGYCGFTHIQDLKDEELPPSARQRMGLEPGPGAYVQTSGHQDAGGMGGVGGLLTGMMIGGMMGGGNHHHNDDNSGGWNSGDSGGSDWSSGDSGDSGGGDWGGGGDSGGDW